MELIGLIFQVKIRFALQVLVLFCIMYMFQSSVTVEVLWNRRGRLPITGARCIKLLCTIRCKKR